MKKIGLKYERLKIALYGPGSKTDVKIAPVPFPPETLTTGAVVYPDPAFVILTDVIIPLLIIAVAVAVTPLGGA